MSVATLSLALCVSVDREKGGKCSYIITGSLCECGQGKGGECSYIITGSLCECGQGKGR